MSETVHYKGRLRKVSLDGESVEDCAKRLYPGDLDMYDDYTEKMENEGYKHHVVYHDEVYEAEIKKIDPDFEVMEASKNEDGSFSLEVRYYNGGCSFEEAIMEALDNAKE